VLEGILMGGFVPRNRLGMKFQLANAKRHQRMPMKNILSLTIGDGESVTTSGGVRADSGSLSVTGSCTALPSRAMMHFLRGGGAARSPFRSCSTGRLSAGKRLTVSTVVLRCARSVGLARGKVASGQPRASPTRFHTADLFRVLEQTILNPFSTT